MNPATVNALRHLMIGDPVIATVLLPGHDKPIEVEGKVWGISRGPKPRYDVRTADFRSYTNLDAEAVRAAQPADHIRNPAP